VFFTIYILIVVGSFNDDVQTLQIGAEVT